jgi:cytidylate kinase
MPVITLGRQFGAGGKTVGEMLARKLKIDLLDSQLIDTVAQRLQLPKEEVEAEDEQPGSLLHRLLMALGSASGEPMVQPEATAWNPPNVDPVFDTRRAVLEITQHVIKEAARAGNVIIVGRGGAYILRDLESALHVYLRAAEGFRVKAVMARQNLAEEEARRLVKRTDENWTAYIKQVYGHDRNLASHYDLVLDTGRLGYEATVEAILAALRARKLPSPRRGEGQGEGR